MENRKCLLTQNSFIWFPPPRSPVFIPETIVSSPLSWHFRSIWDRGYIRMHCHLLVLCLFLSVVCPQPIPNDNSVYVKCAAFGPLGHRTLHAWPCHTTFYGFLLCSFCVPSSQGEDAAIKILQDKILLYVCECMCSHTHSEQLVRGTGVLKYRDDVPWSSHRASGRPESGTARFPWC